MRSKQQIEREGVEKDCESLQQRTKDCHDTAGDVKMIAIDGSYAQDTLQRMRHQPATYKEGGNMRLTTKIKKYGGFSYIQN